MPNGGRVPARCHVRPKAQQNRVINFPDNISWCRFLRRSQTVTHWFLNVLTASLRPFRWMTEWNCLPFFFFLLREPLGRGFAVRHRSAAQESQRIECCRKDRREGERGRVARDHICPWPPQRRRKLRFSSWQQKERNGEMNRTRGDGPEKGGTLPPVTVISVCQRDSSVCGQRWRSGRCSSCCWADASELRS